MTLFFADLVREACWGVGAGDLALGGALRGHRRFADAVPPGARFPYVILSLSHPDEWEAGEGEIGSGDTLLRLPSASSNGGAAVVFSAGLKTVALAVHADLLAAQAAALAGAATADHDHDAAYQPLDADLSAIAGLATTAFGRGHLALADAAALRGHAGLGTMATQSAGAVAISGGAVHGLSGLTVAGFMANVVGSGATLTLFDNDVGRINRLIAGADAGGAFLNSTYSSGGTGDLRIQCIGATVATFLTGGGMIVNGALTHQGHEAGWRDLPRVTGGIERGKVCAATADLTVPAGAAAGATYRVYNDSGGAITLTPGSGLTLRLAGSAATGARTLAGRGFATIWFNAADEAIVCGSGVS